MSNATMLNDKRRRTCLDRSLSKFQVLSDLHLEVGDQYQSFQIPVRAPFLILAGDIGRLQEYDKYLSFIATQCARFDAVYLVLGNHEFYGISRSDGLARAHKLENDESTLGKLKVLNRRRLDLHPSLCILGCTLQSHIRPENRTMVEQRVKDFQRILDWTVELHNEEHQRDLDWLRTEINSINSESEDKRRAKHILVISHHAPIKNGSSHPSNQNSPWADAFATDLIGVQKEMSRVQWWVFGHTHYTTQWREHGINLISNQRGYVLDPARNGRSIEASRSRGKRRLFGPFFKQQGRHFDPQKCIKIRS
jgi:predicted phosphodiesterase